MKPTKSIAATLVLSACAASANAQIPVIDLHSFAELEQQVVYWKQQLNAMSNQLSTLKQQFTALTGTRGMGLLLPLTYAERNYLPATATGILDAMTGVSAVAPELHARYAAAESRASAISQQMAKLLAASDLSLIDMKRSAVATRASAMETALSAASQRFAELQSLVNAIDKTNDTKGSLDLQARIAAEQAMTINEAAKLSAVTAWSDASLAAAQNKSQEAALTAHGAFTSRFHPHLP